MLQVSELYIYPIKSLSGIAVKSAKITDRGFEHDRRWLLVDGENRFLTQREHPQMALLQPSIENNELKVIHKLNNQSFSIAIDTPLAAGPAIVTIWDDTCKAEFVSVAADQWFSAMLGLQCRLVYMPDETQRIVDQHYAPKNSITSFSDAYPFLIIGQASLDDLNSRLDEPLPMNRFRPNIVFTGGKPFDEDLYNHFKTGGVDFYGVKLCARCVMTTIEQETAKKGKEPLKKLASYRFKNNKILFGQNLIHQGDGEIAVGDELVVLTEHSDERFVV
jgi:uncharacterized protein YcbX